VEILFDDVEPARARSLIEAALGGADERWLDADESRTLLEAYRLPLVAERVAHSEDEAVAIARELGFPVVVKTAAAGAHKSDIGGVALDLRDEAATRTAVARVGLPVLMQPYLENGVELLAGVVQDRLFGPLVAFGAGGILAELIGDAGIRVAPLSEIEAEELVLGGKAGRLVRGFRGQPPADASALIDLVRRLGQLAADLPEVAELDLNPVMAFPDRCVCVDARVRLRRSPSPESAKSW
jgi:succinyl-CoA synthetase beta subunit